ncbi:glutathione transferase [Azotobacter chroococcum]|uniref:glutathione transferase n=1 Tax=Azotobacter chroococcum TaxID=353 RepID=UPI0010393B1D|nr:glutathione transferase [Azotobacter chroococcum]TBW33993.1 glutathione transferase [Azotobacter chroococcum]
MSSNITLWVGKDLVSVFAMSAFVALHEKGLEFHLETVDLKAGEQRSTPYRQISMTCKVPTLVHGDFALSESSAIAEYLDEVFPAPALFPRDVRERARARQLQAWLRSDLQPLRSERPADLFYTPTPVVALSDAAASAATKLLEVADRLVHLDSENLFSEWCIADTDLAIMLNRLTANGDPVPEKLQRYVERQMMRASVRLWMEMPRG